MQLHYVIVLLCLLTVTFAQSYELQLVQVITRHGDRTPEHPIKIDPAVWDCTENVVALNSQVCLFYFFFVGMMFICL